MLRYVFCIVCLCFTVQSKAADRVALVIGIADYQTVSPLRNTVNDADALAQTLEKIGFVVTKLVDATGVQINDTLERFAFEAETAELALIYFAGHGVEVQGENFLIPVDAKINSNADVQAQAVSLKQFLRAVDKARKMRIVILDSCRDSPFEDLIDLSASASTVTNSDARQTRGGGGLAAPAPDRGTLVAFAARDGNVALDGVGKNSPFASALVDSLAQPNLEISLMFRRVRDQVLTNTENQQEPYTYGSLPGIAFFLSGDKSSDVTGAKPQDLKNAWSDLRASDEAQFMEMAAEGDTRALMGLAYRRLNPAESGFNPKEAVEFLSLAAEAGSAEAQYELATQFEAGKGVAQSNERALELYRQAAEQDYADALNDIGFFYFFGSLGLEKDTAKALHFIERAADQRHPQAMFNFAALIDDGVVPDKAPRDAALYLYRALRSGSQDVLEALSDHPDSLERETWRELQGVLKEYAFYQGVLDGDFGPGTKRGLERAIGVTE